MNISWETQSTNAESITYYNVTVEKRRDGRTLGSIQAKETKAFYENLKANTQYTVYVSACAPEDDCGLAAETSAWTLPEGEQEILTLNT